MKSDMDYELAKELKEAGFDQGRYYPQDDFEDAKNPTLSELIEACGESLSRMEKVSAPVNENLFPTIWRVTGYTSYDFKKSSDGRKIEIKDFSLSVAVARLWLSLNKK